MAIRRPTTRFAFPSTICAPAAGVLGVGLQREMLVIAVDAESERQRGKLVIQDETPVIAGVEGIGGVAGWDGNASRETELEPARALCSGWCGKRDGGGEQEPREQELLHWISFEGALQHAESAALMVRPKRPTHEKWERSRRSLRATSHRQDALRPIGVSWELRFASKLGEVRWQYHAGSAHRGARYSVRSGPGLERVRCSLLGLRDAVRPADRLATLLPRELETGPRLTDAPRRSSRGFASKGRVSVQKGFRVRVDAG